MLAILALSSNRWPDVPAWVAVEPPNGALLEVGAEVECPVVELPTLGAEVSRGSCVEGACPVAELSSPVAEKVVGSAAEVSFAR